MQVSHILRGLIRPVLDYALPPRCPGCGVIVGADRTFCLTCWTGLEFLGDPCCARCGLPLPFDLGEGGQCAACLSHPPVYDSARAALAYDRLSGGVAMRLKYGRRLGLARLMADHMARHIPVDAQGEGWLIVPVPLHRWRLWGRGFNQAAVIAAHLGRAREIGVDPYSLVRVRATGTMRGRSTSARRNAVRGAFAVRGDGVRGRNIILIDDVLTTGATAGACVEALHAGGAASVHLLCWARVVRDAPD